MTFNEVLEVIVATMILVIVGITIWPEAKYTEYVVENTEQEFNQHPIVAWKTTHEKWNGKQGDIFVQKSPAATVGDIAIAVKEIFNASNEIKIIGTRHGEKLYESLLGSSDSLSINSCIV